jgi:hypothetical protein
VPNRACLCALPEYKLPTLRVRAPGSIPGLGTFLRKDIATFPSLDKRLVRVAQTVK